METVFKREIRNTQLDPAINMVPYKFLTQEGNGETNMKYLRSTQCKKKKYLYILKQTTNINYTKRGQSTDYAILTQHDLNIYPETCRFTTIYRLILKESAVARKKKNPTQNTW